VASFCTKCGIPLSPDKRFCTACGAPVPTTGSVGAPAGAEQPPAFASTPAYAPPASGFATPPGGAYAVPVAMAPPPVQGGNALKIILIIVAAFVGLAILGVMIFAFGIWRVSRAVHMNSHGDGVTISTPAGEITAGKDTSVSEADLGVPMYPGAVKAEGGMRIKSTNGSMITAVFSTNDSQAQVVEFYKGKLGDNTAVVETGNGTVLTMGKQDKESVMITIGTDTNSSDGGRTKIAIMHTTKK